MPIWLIIALQLLETVIGDLVKNPPPVTASLEDHEAHAEHVRRAQGALDSLKS